MMESTTTNVVVANEAPSSAELAKLAAQFNVDYAKLGLGAEELEGTSEAIAAFVQTENRFPRETAELDSWMNSPAEFAEYVGKNPIDAGAEIQEPASKLADATPAEQAAQKLDKEQAAKDAELAKLASEKALLEAQAFCKSSATTTAEQAAKVIVRERSQQAELGLLFQEHFDKACASGIIPWDNAANMLRSALSLETGESIDLHRPMSINAAADFFTSGASSRAAFTCLPVNTQKALGALFTLQACLDDSGKANGKRAFILSELGHNDAIRAFKWITGQERSESTKFLPSATFAKTGHMQQEHSAQLLKIIGRAARSSDKKKPIDDVASAPEKLANVAIQVNAEKEQAALDRSNNRELVTTLLEAHKKGESLPSASSATNADLPPHGRALAIQESFKKAPELMSAFGKVVETEFFAACFASMGDAGRLSDLQFIRKKIDVEILIAMRQAENGGPAKFSRKQAREVLKEEREQAALAKLAK